MKDIFLLQQVWLSISGITVNDAEGGDGDWGTNSSTALSLLSNFRHFSRSRNASVPNSSHPASKLDENCSVVDHSMKWEDFRGFYKLSSPFDVVRPPSQIHDQVPLPSPCPLSISCPTPPEASLPMTQIMPALLRDQQLFNPIDSSWFKDHTRLAIT